MTSSSKFPLPKKRGRPLGSKNKRRVAKKMAAKDKPFKQAEVYSLAEKLLNDELFNELDVKIINLENQIIGYKAVISYLEFQLGKTK